MVTAASTSDRRRILHDLARERGQQEGSSRLVRRAAMGIVILAILTLLALWLTGFFSVAPEVLEIRSLVDGQIEELRRVARNETPLSYDSPGFGAVLDRMRDMPQPLRERAGREVGRLFEAREQAEMDSYFGMPPEKRAAELDRRIRAEEERRQARDAARAKRDEQRGGPRPAGPTAVGQPGGTARGFRGSTEESRNASMKRRIDNTTPVDRARRTEYRRAMDERRTQLGLPTRGGRW